MIVVISSSGSSKPLIPMKDNERDMIGVEWAVNIVVAHYIAYIADISATASGFILFIIHFYKFIFST